MNQIKRVKIKDKIEKRQKEIITYEDFIEFDKYLCENYKNDNVRLYFNLLYYTGARPNEICGLMIEDIDFINGVIDINKTRLKYNLSNTPKSVSGIRKVTIPNIVCEMLSEYIKKLTVKKGYIFEIYNKYIKVLNKSFLKNKGLHIFRHSHASFLINKGIDITTISKRLGHSNTAVTMNTYAHFYKELDDKVVNLLNNISESRDYTT